MKNLAIITARGGSKRIPKKNIKDFCGKPIIAYTIEAALGSKLFDEVMVSTDSEEIAAVALKFGAKVPFYRSEFAASDSATTNDVLAEVLDMYEERGQVFDNYCCLYPTAPFLTSDRLVHAYDFFLESNASLLNPVVRFSFPPQRGFIIVDGELKYMFPENALTRSQDLEPMYHDCGQFYIYSNKMYDVNGDPVKASPHDINPPKKLFYDKCGNRKKIIAYVMPELEVQDIDNPDDWEIAETKYKIIHNG
ncbi:MAG: pseudaminic acid cytidylyltransferase [Clostridia bacterium]|nr:pseudaminic acid cytidylyltransferase [Clostridia bacterium]